MVVQSAGYSISILPTSNGELLLNLGRSTLVSLLSNLSVNVAEVPGEFMKSVNVYVIHALTKRKFPENIRLHWQFGFKVSPPHT